MNSILSKSRARRRTTSAQIFTLAARGECRPREGFHMPRLFDARQEAFCNFYVRGPYAGMVCDANEAAGYARDSGNASRLLRQHEIGRRIAELRAGEAALARQAELAAFEQLKIDKIRIAQELAKVGFADLSDYVGDGGALDFKRLAQASGPAVRDLNI